MANLPEPRTRLEQYWAGILEKIEGGGGVTVEALSVTENGTYTAQVGTAYSPVNVGIYPVAVSRIFDDVTEDVRYQIPTDINNLAFFTKSSDYEDEDEVEVVGTLSRPSAVNVSGQTDYGTVISENGNRYIYFEGSSLHYLWGGSFPRTIYIYQYI